MNRCQVRVGATLSTFSFRHSVLGFVCLVLGVGAPVSSSCFVEKALAQSPGSERDAAAAETRISLGQGMMSGEVTSSSALVQARLTKGTTLDERGDLPGHDGVVCFEWSTTPEMENAKRTGFRAATAESDFIVREKLDELSPGTKYYYRALYGERKSATTAGPVGSFSTLGGVEDSGPVRFIVGSCMNYNKFMHGKAGNAGNLITATAEDKRLGFPVFVTMKRMQPDFFVGTGDIVYYDNPFRRSESVWELRRCWHEQFRFPRMIDFFRNVPTYWSKDDHDFRYNDSDNSSTRLPLPTTGIDMFREQLPIADDEAENPVTYRTYRVSRDLQIWLTEGRDYRSPNRSADGPEKTLWGEEQKRWLQSTLKASDAKWKLLISPTPLVGPDLASKQDNHTSLGGFQYEAKQFFDWLTKNDITNLTTICGDRHWQYHSIHPSGVHEFACGALNDENARLGVVPGSKKGTDPEGRITQHYISPQPSGGFLQVTVGDNLVFELYSDDGQQHYRFARGNE